MIPYALMTWSLVLGLASFSGGAASSPAPGRAKLHEVFSSLRSMTVLSVPEGGEGVRFDPYSRRVYIPLQDTSEGWQRELRERASASPQIAGMVWQEGEQATLWLSSMRTSATIVQTPRRSAQLILGEPRQAPSPRHAWFGSACAASMPQAAASTLQGILESMCQGQEVEPDELHAFMALQLDAQGSRTRQLLLLELGHEDALSGPKLLDLHSGEPDFRSQVYISMALAALQEDRLDEALAHLLTARTLADDAQRWEDASGAMGLLMERLSQGVARRHLEVLLQTQPGQALAFFERHPRQLSDPATARRVAIAYRLEKKPELAIALYQQALGALPEERAHAPRREAIIGELATTYLEAGDAYRARAISLWKQESEQAVPADFEGALRWVASGKKCPAGKSWTQLCESAPKPAASARLDLLSSPQQLSPWGEEVKVSNQLPWPGK